MLSLKVAAVSDIGRVRKKNDDSGYVGPHLIVVADGMGGAPAGDLASTVVIQTIKRLDAPPPDDLLQALAGTILIANERLAEIIDEDPAVDGMGSTVTAALFDGARIGVAHLGDSRGYLWRDGTLHALTRDHTWVQSLIDEGRITEEEAKEHSHRSLLLKVLDGRHDNEPDLSLHDVQHGDRILICSDGLSGVVPEDQIERVLAVGSPEAVATDLTTLALDSGSTDNVTVLVGDVVEDDEAESTVPSVVGAAGDSHRGPVARMRSWGQRDAAEPREIVMTDPEGDPEQLRYAPRAPRRFLYLRRAFVLLLILAVVGGGLAFAYQWSQTQYFVAADRGRVAIYQGVDAQLPGIELNHVYEEQPLRLSALPAFRRSQVVAGLTADSLPKAKRIVAELLAFARECATSPPTTPSPTLTLPAPPRSTASPTPPVTGQNQTATTIAPPTGLLPPARQHSGGAPRECSGTSSSSGTTR
ncbi:MAG: PP2C family protein-serine/threonine phosphatase [Nocardioidaceae bacterium]